MTQLFIDRLRRPNYIDLGKALPTDGADSVPYEVVAGNTNAELHRYQDEDVLPDDVSTKAVFGDWAKSDRETHPGKRGQSFDKAESFREVTDA